VYQLNYVSFQFMLPYEQKSFYVLNKQCFYWSNVQCQKLQVLLSHDRFASRLLPINDTEIHCSGVWSRYTVVMETTQLALSQFNK